MNTKTEEIPKLAKDIRQKKFELIPEKSKHVNIYNIITSNYAILSSVCKEPFIPDMKPFDRRR